MEHVLLRQAQTCGHGRTEVCVHVSVCMLTDVHEILVSGSLCISVFMKTVVLYVYFIPTIGKRV